MKRFCKKDSTLNPANQTCQITRATAIAAGLFLLISAADIQGAGNVYQGADLRIRHRGVLRNVLVTGRTLDFFGPGKDYLLDIQRLRSDWLVSYRENFRFRVVYDHELRLGDYLETLEYEAGKDFDPPELVDLDDYLSECSRADWRHRLYRLNFEVDLYPVRLVVGRQQISWGTGYFWNPTDLFNPIAFLLIEQDERFGADAVSLEVGLGGLSQVQAVWAPTRDPHRSRGAAKLKTNLHEYDISLMGGWMFRDRLAGADFSGQIGGAGFRGEWLHNFAWERQDYDQLVLGVDYRFNPRFLFTAEYFYNSGPLSEHELQQGLNLAQIGSVVSFSHHLAGVYGDFKAHPLIHLSAYLSVDLEHGGVFAGPRFSWNILTNLDLQAGAQLSSNRGEFSWFENSYYLTTSWYF